MIYNNIYKDGKLYKRANKVKAERLFNEGINLLIYPINANPHNKWIGGISINKNTNGYNFNKIINEIKYYNCNSEIGQYLKYYYVIQDNNI